MKFFKKIVFLLYTVYCMLYTATSVFAQLPSWSNTSGETPAKISDLEVVFSRILGIAIPAAGIAAFIMLIAGGFKYLTSGGDPKKSQEAQQTITYAVIGLILLVSAYIIINSQSSGDHIFQTAMLE